MLSQSLSISSGFAGMLSLSQAGFYGIGAYFSAILSISFNINFLVLLPLAILFCGIISLIISIVSLRTVDDYFIVCTLGIQVIIYSVMNNWVQLTNGPMGIPKIPPISIFGYIFTSKMSFLFLTLFFVLLIYSFLMLITHSSFGLILKGLQEDEIYSMALGKNVYKAKIICFVLSSMIAAVPGVLYAHYFSYINPSSFTVDESIFILSIVIIGGMQNLNGIALAAVFLVLLPEFLRLIGLPNNVAANLREILYGLTLIFVVFRYNNGFIYKKHRQSFINNKINPL